MEPQVMGKVLVRAKVENLADITDVERGLLKADQVRTIDVDDALVDTGATMLSMPLRPDQSVGDAPPSTSRPHGGGMRDMGIYSGVQLTIQGRDCLMEVRRMPDDCPVLDRSDSARGA